MKEQFYLEHIVGVIGKNISSDPSAVIYNAAFASLGLDDWRCVMLPVDADKLEDAIRGLRAFKTLRGFSCLAPHTVEVMKYLNVIENHAKRIGAVNVITDFGDYSVGDNTSGKGFMMSLAENGVSVAGKRIVVLGAGGTARAICVELGFAGAAEITVVNRSRSRAEQLLEVLREHTGVQANFVEWCGTYSIPKGTDIVVNATPVGLYPKIEEMPDVDTDSFGTTMFVQDTIPSPLDTMLIREMRSRKIPCATGAGMLINQAALNVKLWSGLEPDKNVMYKALT